MRNIPFVVIGLGVLLFGFGGYWSQTWWSKWFFLSIIFSLALSVCAAKKTSWFYFPMMAWVLCVSTFDAFELNHSPLAEIFRPDVLQLLEKNSLYTLMTAVAAIWTFSIFESSWYDGVQLMLASMWAIGTAAYLIIPDLPNHGWQFGNPSMGASLLVCLLPFVWDRFRLVWMDVVFWLLTALAIYRTHTSIAVGILAVVTVIYWLPKVEPIARHVFLILVGCAFVIQHALSRKVLLDTNGRYPVWELAYTWTRDHGMIWTGIGAGSIQTIMPILQVQNGVRLPDFFIWLHSDWLQVLVEFGWIGLAFALLALGRLMWKAILSGRSGRIASLVGFSALAVFDYPIRLPIHFFCLLMICSLIENADRLHLNVTTAQSDLKKPA